MCTICLLKWDFLLTWLIDHSDHPSFVYLSKSLGYHRGVPLTPWPPEMCSVVYQILVVVIMLDRLLWPQKSITFWWSYRHKLSRRLSSRGHLILWSPGPQDFKIVSFWSCHGTEYFYASSLILIPVCKNIGSACLLWCWPPTPSYSIVKKLRSCERPISSVVTTLSGENWPPKTGNQIMQQSALQSLPLTVQSSRVMCSPV